MTACEASSLTLESQASRLHQYAALVVYRAEIDHDDAASRAFTLFRGIQEVSGLSPMETLVIVGCLDAQIASDAGEELDIAETISHYIDSGQVDYIERNMIGSLGRFFALLSALDSRLADAAIPLQNRPAWVRAGLDYPSSEDGAGRMISMTTVDRKGWDAAGKRLDAYADKVARLPHRVRRGEVDLDQILNTVAGVLSDLAVSAAPR